MRNRGFGDEIRAAMALLPKVGPENVFEALKEVRRRAGRAGALHDAEQASIALAGLALGARNWKVAISASYWLVIRFPRSEHFLGLAEAKLRSGDRLPSKLLLTAFYLAIREGAQETANRARNLLFGLSPTGTFSELHANLARMQYNRAARQHLLLARRLAELSGAFVEATQFAATLGRLAWSAGDQGLRAKMARLVAREKPTAAAYLELGQAEAALGRVAAARRAYRRARSVGKLTGELDAVNAARRAQRASK